MDVADPLCAVASTTCFLPRTVGGPAPAASPSKADEALLRRMPEMLKESKELIEQSKIALKEYSDVHMAYQDDGGKAPNCRNNQLGRRPGGERKRHRFTMKYPASKPLPVVDRSVLDLISDPDEYYAKEKELDEAEAAIERLKGKVQPEMTLNFEPVVEPKRRNSSRLRKSYFFSSDAHASSATMMPLSQSENMTESQTSSLTSQDDAHASVSEKIQQSVPSKSDKCATSDNLMEEDLINEKDKGDEITNIMGSFQEYVGPDKLDFLRKKIGIGEIPMEKIYRHDSVHGDPLGITAGINLQHAPSSGSHQAQVSELEKHIFRDADNDKGLSKDDGFEGHTRERPLPGSHQARVSELAKLVFRDAAAMDIFTDLLKDDEFEGSPEIVMREQSLSHDSSDVDLTTDETFSAREKDREARSSSAKSAQHVIHPEPNVPEGATIDDNPSSRHGISTEEGNVPMDHSPVDESNNEAVISSHPLEDASTEALAKNPGRTVASGSAEDIAETLHSDEDDIHYQAVIEEDGVVQDKSIHSLEMPLEDIGLQNQSQAPDGTIKELTADLRNVPSPTKEKTQKASKRVKTKEQPKRGKKVADGSRHSLEIPQADFNSENQPETHDASAEELLADVRVLSPTIEKTQKATKRGKHKQQTKRGKKVADESCNSLEISQTDLEMDNRPHRHDVNTEEQTVVMRNAVSPSKPKGQKKAQRRNRAHELNKRQSLADAGLEFQSGVRRSTRVRYRPLEEWRGERVLYGRIHDSLVTVIGVKSYSPDKDGKAVLKVKSFVPEQYSDILAESAKH